MLRVFADTYGATLSGNMAVLRRYYSMHLHQDEDGWNLRLPPSDPEPNRFIDHIVVQGLGTQIRQIDIYETGGDHTVTSITPSNG